MLDSKIRWALPFKKEMFACKIPLLFRVFGKGGRKWLWCCYHWESRFILNFDKESKPFSVNNGWAEFYCLYMLVSFPKNLLTVKCISHVKVACDLVEWAEVCPTTHCFWDCFLLCKLHISSSVHGAWFSHWLGAAFRNADGLAESVSTDLNKGAEHEKLWLTAVGFAHPQQGCSLGGV